MKALLVRLSSIGDVVHTLPVLAALRTHGWEAGWAVEPAARPILEHHPLLAHTVPIPGARAFGFANARIAVEALRAQRYDVALDLQGLWKSAAWARLSGAPRVVGYARAWRREPLSSVLVRELSDLPPDLPHVIDKNLALLRPLGIEAVGLREFPLLTNAARASATATDLADLGLKDFVVLNPGGGWASKLWSPERYGEIARGLRERGLQTLVTWGPGEERLADRVTGASEGAVVRCPPTTLLEYVEIVRRARLVVAADTGPLHLACAAGTPVVGIYGPTDPARNGPFSPADRVVRRTPLCSPCHKRRCRIHEGVMDAITAPEVLAVIDKRLGVAKAPQSVAV
ncbi:MAG: glycosyltransferase family 9 protein [Acidobacteria bacterium]|nr:glycosyltransferase family 9 protein [Acidobacteriota bacterium]